MRDYLGRCSRILVYAGSISQGTSVGYDLCLPLTIPLSRVKILELPWYDALLLRGKERGSALLLDVGCACKSYYMLGLYQIAHTIPPSWY